MHNLVGLQAGSGPLESKIPANLRANFSSQYLNQKIDGRTRREVRLLTFATQALSARLLLLLFLEPAAGTFLYNYLEPGL